jgi:hypothetical protein
LVGGFVAVGGIWVGGIFVLVGCGGFVLVGLGTEVIKTCVGIVVAVTSRAVVVAVAVAVEVTVWVIVAVVDSKVGVCVVDEVGCRVSGY